LPSSRGLPVLLLLLFPPLPAALPELVLPPCPAALDPASVFGGVLV
jgi:hypothetical protein